MNSHECKKMQMTYFSRWKNKSYAVFNSLKGVVHISVLRLSYFSVFIPGFVLGQSDSTFLSRVQAVDEVIVEEEQLEATLSSAAIRTISVLQAADIEQSSATSLAELLNYALNVDVRSRGPHDTQADVSIRGGNYNQVMILLNGINISDPQTGHQNMSIPINLDDIERVEVLSGAGAFKWGSHAFSGAVNIITSEKVKERLKLRAETGSDGYYDFQGSAGVGKKKFQNRFSGAYAQSDGYRKNTDFSRSNLSYQGSLATSQGSGLLQVAHSNSRCGANSFYSAKYPDQFMASEVSLASLSWTTKGRLQLSPSAYYRRNKSRFELFRYDAPAWYKNHNYHINQVYGVNLGAMYKSKLGVSYCGVRVRNESIKSNVLGNPVSNPEAVKGVDSVFYDKQYERTNYSLYLEHGVSLGTLYTSVSAMAFQSSTIEDKVFFFLEAHLGLPLSPLLYWGLTANQSMRMPTFTDLFYEDPTHRGNAYLQPEEAVSYETKLKFKHTEVKADLSVFYRQGKNLIDWVQYEKDKPFESINQAKVNTLGISFQASSNLSFSKQLQAFKVQYTYLDIKNRADDVMKSYYVLQNLKHQFLVSLRHQLFHPSMSLQWTYSYYDRADGESSGEESFEPYGLVEVKQVWKRKQYSIFAAVTNLLDVEYFDYAHIPLPGRRFSIGVKWQY